MTLFVSLLISFITIRGFRFTITENGLTMQNTLSFIWLPVLLFLVHVLSLSLKERNSRLKIFAVLFSVITGVCFIAGAGMEKTKGISWIWRDPDVSVNVLNLFFSHAVLYYCAAFSGFKYLGQDRRTAAETGIFSFRRVLIYWLILLILYLPWYMHFYPGIVTQDTADQINDAITQDGIRDHHSAFLTLMMRLVILPLRHMTGSLQNGVAVTTLLQMLIVTFIFALTCVWVRKYLTNTLSQVFVFLWYAIFPVNNIYSVTLWKDILFSVCFLALLLCLDAAAEDEENYFSSRMKRLALLLTLALLPLMRHNGILISAAMCIFLPLRFRHHRRQTGLICCGALLVFGLWKLLVLPALHVTEIPAGQALSVLEQQMARAMNVHHEELSPEEMKEFTRYFDIEDLWTRYKPEISDPVKRHFRDDLYRADPAGFFSSWAKLGRRYPVDYFEALLANNYGYWFPETHYWVVSSGVDAGKWDIEDVHAAPLFSSGVLTKVSDYISGDQFLKIPLLPLLFSRGACFWIWIFCGCFCLFDNRKKFILFLCGLSLWTGILISPVYNEYRYVYGLFIGLPLMMVSAIGRREPDIGDHSR